MGVLVIVLISILPLSLVYFLYTIGLFEVKTMFGFAYVGSLKNLSGKCHRASYAMCSGTVKKVLKLSGNERYVFSLDSEVSKGTVEIKILNSEKAVVLDLSDAKRRGDIQTAEKERYYLQIKFKKAEGYHNLEWQKIEK